MGVKKSDFESNLDSKLSELKDLLVSKRNDYGTRNILDTPFGAEKGVLVRLNDKVARLINLLSEGKEPKNETLDDTWRDIANYAIIALMVREGTFRD